MTPFLDVLPFPKDWKENSTPYIGKKPQKDISIKGEPKKPKDVKEAQLNTEVPDTNTEPLLDGSQQPMEGTAVAALAVMLLLGASLLAMNKLKK